MPVLDTQRLIDNRIHALRDFHEKARTQRAELDISGGVDSAVMLGLLERALGKENITAVHSRIHSSDESLARAQEVASVFDVPLITIDLTPHFEALLDSMLMAAQQAGYALSKIRTRIQEDPTILGSIRSCLRAPLGRGFNRLTGGGIRHGTGNECEDRFLRFYQKGGDGEVDSNPIAMLSKGEVFQLGRALKVPLSILEATPTPDLQGVGDRHNDEQELLMLTAVPWTYSRVDADTGQYTTVGSIERMSRFLDFQAPGNKPVFEVLFQDRVDESTLEELTLLAAPFFDHSDLEEVRAFVHSARTIEARTRHKMNPNCPSLGTREELIREAILSNELPKGTPS